MGRLPTEFAGRRITYRIPYTMPGELVVPASATGVVFPDATFSHNTDKPFEIHRLIPRVTPLDSSGLVINAAVNADDLELLERMTRIRVQDLSQNEVMTKNAQLLSSLTKGSAEKTWEWAEPYTIVRSMGFQITVDNIATNAIVGNGYQSSRVEITFEGFLLVVAAPNQR